MLMKIFKKIIQFWCSFSKIEIISGHGADTPYLVRYHLVNTSFCKLYAHYFMRKDEDDPHSHPWSYASLMLSGSYTEELYNMTTKSFTKTVRTPKNNCFLIRNSDAIHRVVVDRALSLDEIEHAPMTLFFATKKSKEWGFIVDYETNPKFVHWKKYLGVK